MVTIYLIEVREVKFVKSFYGVSDIRSNVILNCFGCDVGIFFFDVGYSILNDFHFAFLIRLIIDCSKVI